MRCPSTADILTATLSLLPRGRAWQTNEGLPRQQQEIGFDPVGFNNTAFSTTEAPNVMWSYWRSFAEVLSFLTQRLCDLRLEFWCQTVKETRDEWMVEYGLPDPCDPFPDLCTKVAAIGGTRCEYYQFIAARAGWSITCVENHNQCGTRTGGKRSRAGHMRSGKTRPGSLRIRVDLGKSWAFIGPRRRRALAGRFRAGQRPGCGPSLTPLECILGRVVHAEIQIEYEVANVA